MSKSKTYIYAFIFVVFCALVGVVFYFHHTAKKCQAELQSLQHKATEKAAVCLAIPLQNDNLGVKLWASIAAMRMLTIDSNDTNLVSYSSLTQPFFTGSEWTQWLSEAKKMNNFIGKQSAFLAGSPVLSESGLIANTSTYRWVVKVPYRQKLTTTTKTANGNQSQEKDAGSGIVTLTIVTVKPPAGFKGLAINKVAIQKN